MQTVGELIERNASCYPNQEAFVLGEQRQTYAAYARRARRLASALEGLGAMRQDRIGVFSTNSIEFYEAYGACEIAGFIAAPYNFRSAEPELFYLLQDSAPRVVLFEHTFTPIVDAVRGRFPELQWICIGPADAVPGWALGYETLLDRGSEQGPRLRSRPDDLVYLFYTSGTTGKPKGVPWNHRGALEAARDEGRAMGPDCRLLQISPAFHTGGKGIPIGALLVAGTTVLDRGFDAGRFLSIVARERITHTFMVPVMMQAVMDHAEFSRPAVSSLRAVMTASTPIPVPMLLRAIALFGPVFYVAYGSTEAGGVARLELHELRPQGSEDDVRRLGSVGHFHPEREAVLLDEAGRPCPRGSVGEVSVKSPVFIGYWNNSVATIEATRDGWLRTGDLGYLDENDFLFLVDRRKDMIISGGENIYSREVEDALLRHPSVRAAAVIGVPDEKWGEAVKAFVVLAAGGQLEAAELGAHCRAEIARYKCPRSIEFATELPMLSTGKVDKVMLRKRQGQAPLQ